MRRTHYILNTNNNVLTFYKDYDCKGEYEEVKLDSVTKKKWAFDPKKGFQFAKLGEHKQKSGDYSEFVLNGNYIGHPDGLEAFGEYRNAWIQDILN